jgi:hypothetical protein
VLITAVDPIREAKASTMERIDALPWRWRKLVHELGWSAVKPWVGTSVTAIELREILKAKRARRQAKVLLGCA